jgi:hypothetical protein
MKGPLPAWVIALLAAAPTVRADPPTPRAPTLVRHPSIVPAPSGH